MCYLIRCLDESWGVGWLHLLLPDCSHPLALASGANRAVTRLALLICNNTAYRPRTRVNGESERAKDLDDLIDQGVRSSRELAVLALRVCSTLPASREQRSQFGTWSPSIAVTLILGDFLYSMKTIEPFGKKIQVPPKRMFPSTRKNSYLSYCFNKLSFLSYKSNVKVLCISTIDSRNEQIII